MLFTACDKKKKKKRDRDNPGEIIEPQLEEDLKNELDDPANGEPTVDDPILEEPYVDEPYEDEPFEDDYSELYLDVAVLTTRCDGTEVLPHDGGFKGFSDEYVSLNFHWMPDEYDYFHQMRGGFDVVDGHLSHVKTHCRVEAELVAPEGWAFAIKSVNMEVINKIFNHGHTGYITGDVKINDVPAFGWGDYHFHGRGHEAVENVYIEWPEEELEWFGCGEYASNHYIKFHTEVGLTRHASFWWWARAHEYSSLKIKNSSHNFDVVWSRCP